MKTIYEATTHEELREAVVALCNHTYQQGLVDGRNYNIRRAEVAAHAAVIAAALAAEMTLTSMAHAEALYGGRLADQVLALIDAVVQLRATTTEATR